MPTPWPTGGNRPASGSRQRPVLLRPSWADPMMLLNTGVYTCTPVIFTGAADNELIAAADPERWMIAFQRPILSVTTADVRPSGSPPEFGQRLTTDLDLWFTLFTHGLMVAFEWRVTLSAAETILVHEVKAR